MLPWPIFLRFLKHPCRALRLGSLWVSVFRVLCLVSFSFVTLSLLVLIQLGSLVLEFLFQVGYLSFQGPYLFRLHYFVLVRDAVQVFAIFPLCLDVCYILDERGIRACSVLRRSWVVSPLAVSESINIRTWLLNLRMSLLVAVRYSSRFESLVLIIDKATFESDFPLSVSLIDIIKTWLEDHQSSLACHGCSTLPFHLMTGSSSGKWKACNYLGQP